MTNELGVVAAAVLVFAGTALGLALLAAVLARPVRRAICVLPPANQSALLLAFIAIPALAGLALVALALAPTLSHLVGLSVDHCHGHGHHGHFCPTHAPLWTGGGLDWLTLILAGLAVAALGGDLPRRLLRVRRVVRDLEILRVPSRESGSCRVVDVDGPLALTAGLLRPRVYVSRPLFDALAPTELAAVLGHEWAHRERRDALRLLAAELLSRLHLPRIRRHLLVDLTLATERACDEAAAGAGAGRLGVAAALLTVVRLNAGGGHASAPLAGEALVPSLGGADLEARIEALLRPAPVQAGVLSPGVVVTSAAGLLLALGWLHADRLHHGIESVLYLLMT
jgi:Zn-dependent protease with chaperone function